MVHPRRLWKPVLGVCMALAAVGCGVTFKPLPAGSIAGRAGLYDYSPSATLSGDSLDIWWCGNNFNPKNLQAWFNGGMIQHEEGMLHPALQSYLHALELDPRYAEAHFNLGTTLRLQNRTLEAESCGRRARFNSG